MSPRPTRHRAARCGALVVVALAAAALPCPAGAAVARAVPAADGAVSTPLAAPSIPAPSIPGLSTPAPAAGPSVSTPPALPPVPPRTAGPVHSTPAAGPLPPAPAADPLRARRAATLAAEERRLARLRGQAPALAAATAPYLAAVAGRTVAVLVPRPAPYTVADLRRSLPSVFTAPGPRTYLLAAPLLVPAGATLDVADPLGLTLRLASGPDGDANVYVLGGRITVTGGPGTPTTVTSWNRRARAPDGDTADGRAHVRVLDGTAQFTYAAFLRLGFGTGATGGVSVTGAPPARGGVPYTALIRSVKFAGNAVGVHLADTAGVVVAHTTVAGNLADGLVLAGAVRDARITQVAARGNRGSGFVSPAAARGVDLVMCRAEENRQDGFLVADHPGAVGPPPAAGGTTITGGVARNNAHHGVAVDGAARLTLRSNWVVGGDMGIVLRHAAGVTVANNQIRETRRHGVAVLSGTGASVVDNVIADVGNGVYVRDAVAVVRGNTVTKAHTHGISFVGAAAGSAASENLLATTGPSAVDTAHSAGGVEIGENRTLERKPGRTAWAAVSRHATPTTILWALLLLLAAGTGLAGRRRPRVGGRAPYGPGPIPGTAPAAVPAPAPSARPAPTPDAARVPTPARAPDARSATTPDAAPGTVPRPGAPASGLPAEPDGRGVW